MMPRTWRQFLAEADAAAPTASEPDWDYADSRIAWAVRKLADADGYLMVASILTQAKTATKIDKASGWAQAWEHALFNVRVDCDEAAASFLQSLAVDGEAGENLKVAVEAEIKKIGNLAMRVGDQAQALVARKNVRGTDLQPLRNNLRQAVGLIPELDSKDVMSGIDGVDSWMDGQSGWRGLSQAIMAWEGSDDEQDVMDNAREAASIVASGNEATARTLLDKVVKAWGRPFSEVDFGDDVWIPNFEMHPEAQRRYREYPGFGGTPGDN